MFDKAKLFIDNKKYDVLFDNNLIKISSNDRILNDIKLNTYNFNKGIDLKIKDETMYNIINTWYQKNISILYENMEIKCYYCNRINFRNDIYNLKFEFYNVKHNLRSKKLKKILYT